MSITLCGHLPQPPPPPVPAAPSLNCCPPRWSGIPIAPAHFFSTLNTVSSVGVQLKQTNKHETWNSIWALLTAAISLNRRRHRCRRHRRSIAARRVEVEFQLPLPISSQLSIQSLQSVSSSGSQCCPKLAAKNTKMWCSILTAFIKQILFIFWNWKTWYNLQRRIEKYLRTAKTPTWIT